MNELAHTCLTKSNLFERITERTAVAGVIGLGYIGPLQSRGRALERFSVFGPIIAGKFQFSGIADSGRWTRKDNEAIEIYRGADRFHRPGSARPRTTTIGARSTVA
jgi:hypothetical protein